MDRRQLPGWVQALNQAAPSIISATLLGGVALLFSTHQNVTRIDGHMRSFSESLNRITLRVDRVEADMQATELTVRELQTMIQLAR